MQESLTLARPVIQVIQQPLYTCFVDFKMAFDCISHDKLWVTHTHTHAHTHARTHARTHTHTHTRLTALFPGLPR